MRLPQSTSQNTSKARLCGPRLVIAAGFAYIGHIRLSSDGYLITGPPVFAIPVFESVLSRCRMSWRGNFAYWPWWLSAHDAGMWPAARKEIRAKFRVNKRK